MPYTVVCTTATTTTNEEDMYGRGDGHGGGGGFLDPTTHSSLRLIRLCWRMCV